MKRMFHPTLNDYVDVADGDVQEWADAGWRKSQPDHVQVPANAPKPGEAQPAVDIPREVPILEDTSRTTTSGTRAGSGSRTSGSRSGGSTSAATSSAATGTTPSA